MAKTPKSASGKSTSGDTPVADLTKAAAKKELARLADAIRAADAAYYQEDGPHLPGGGYGGGVGLDATFVRERVVDVGEHAGHGRERGIGAVGKRS